jgi:hypothetical protein
LLFVFIYDLSQKFSVLCFFTKVVEIRGRSQSSPTVLEVFFHLTTVVILSEVETRGALSLRNVRGLAVP